MDDIDFPFLHSCLGYLCLCPCYISDYLASDNLWQVEKQKRWTWFNTTSLWHQKVFCKCRCSHSPTHFLPVIWQLQSFSQAPFSLHLDLSALDFTGTTAVISLLCPPFLPSYCPAFPPPGPWFSPLHLSPHPHLLAWADELRLMKIILGLESDLGFLTPICGDLNVSFNLSGFNFLIIKMRNFG